MCVLSLTVTFSFKIKCKKALDMSNVKSRKLYKHGPINFRTRVYRKSHNQTMATLYQRSQPSQKAICVWTLFLAAVWKVVLWGILLLSIYIPSVKSLCLKQSRRCTFVRRLCLWIACTHIVGMSLVVLLHLQIEFFFTWSKTDIVHTLRKNTGNGWDSSQAVKRLQWGIFNDTSGKHKHIITHTEYSSHSSIR